MTLARKLTIEFIGTFFLVFTVGMALATAGDLAPLAIGSVLMVMVFAGGHISGGFYNPAVTLAVFLRGRLAAAEVAPYVVAQCVAGILGGLLVRGLGYNPAHALAVAGDGKMLVVELLFTFALAYVVLNVATSSDTANNSFYGLAIGFTLAVAAFAVGSVSGAAINPAVALGGSVAGVFAWSHIWVYLIAEVVGGGAAAAVYMFTQPAAQPAQLAPTGVGTGMREVRAWPKAS
ncbi:MAG TPA: aquaporin [Baekduia sp.]